MSPIQGDSSDDDDDLLLSAAPIFSNKNNRKEKASEKRNFNFLDSMLKKEEKRNEQQTRIHDLKAQEKKRVEEDNAKEEEGMNQKVEGEQKNNNTETKQGDTISDDKSNKIGNQNSKVEGSKKKIDINDEEYWSKLQARAKDSLLSSKYRDQRMQNLRDAVDGLDELRDDAFGGRLLSEGTRGERAGGNIHDATDSHNMDESSAERERRMASLGLVTGKSTFIGTRRVFGTNSIYHHHHHDGEDSNSAATIDSSLHTIFSSFQSLEEAMAQLDSIIQTLDKPASRGLGSQKHKKMWNAMRTQLVTPIKKAINLDILPLLLEKRKQWGGEEASCCSNSKNGDHNGNGSLIISINLIKWMVRTSLSGKTVGSELHMAAKEMISQVFRSDNLIILDEESMKMNSDHESVIDHVFNIKDFVPILELQFGLWVKEGPLPPPPTLNLPQSCNDSERNHHSKSFGNEAGLRNAFDIWSIGFEKNLVAWDGEFAASCSKQSWDENEICVCAMTSRFIAMLCRSGLDPSFHHGHRLLQAQGNLLNQIFDWMQLNFETHSADMSYFDKWIEHTAKLSATLCSDFSTDIIPAGETKSDNNGFLPLLLAVRTCQTVDQTKEKVVTFFAFFSCHAAQICMGGVTKDWDSKVETDVHTLVNDIYGNDSSNLASNNLRMKCVATAEVILKSIKDVGEEITRNGPHFLAAVDIAVNCEHMGITLFKMNAQNVEKPAGIIYETRSEIEAMNRRFERLEKICNDLKKKVTSVLVDKNMMRVKELLSLIGGIYRDCKNSASSFTDGRESIFSKQTNMDSYIKGGNSHAQDAE